MDNLKRKWSASASLQKPTNKNRKQTINIFITYLFINVIRFVHSNHLFFINNNMDTNLDIMRPIIGSQKISKYLGYDKDHFLKRYGKLMLEKGYMWKKGAYLTSPVMTTPFLINLFLTEYHDVFYQTDRRKDKVRNIKNPVKDRKRNRIG